MYQSKAGSAAPYRLLAAHDYMEIAFFAFRRKLHHPEMNCHTLNSPFRKLSLLRAAWIPARLHQYKKASVMLRHCLRFLP